MKKPRETWTFEPDAEVVAAIREAFGGEMPKGDRTQIINDALRLHHADATIITAESELFRAKARLEKIREVLQKPRSTPYPISSTQSSALNETQHRVDRVAKKGAKEAVDKLKS